MANNNLQNPATPTMMDEELFEPAPLLNSIPKEKTPIEKDDLGSETDSLKSSDEDEEVEMEEDQSNISWLTYFFKLSFALVIISPAVYLIVSDPTRLPNLNATFDDLLSSGQFSPSSMAVRWLIWSTFVWLAGVNWWYILLFLPVIIVRVLIRVTGSCPEKIRLKLYVYISNLVYQ